MDNDYTLSRRGLLGGLLLGGLSGFGGSVDRLDSHIVAHFGAYALNNHTLAGSKTRSHDKLFAVVHRRNLDGSADCLV